MAKLSIITICYNDLQGLKKTVESVKGQSFTDFEYILIDGGSTDGTTEFIRDNEAVFTHCVSEKDHGIYNAQNKGWKLASGDYCLFLNSGDFLCDSEVLSSVFKAQPTADLVYGDILVDNGRDPLYRLGQHDPFTFEDMIYTTLFHPATFIRKSLLERQNGYDEGFRIVADYDFFLRALFVTKCTTRYLSIPITVFNTAGVGSDPANKVLHDAERKTSQLRYFSAEKIARATQEVQKRKPRSVKLQDAVSGIPVLREITNFGLKMYNRIRRK
jgi:glycosyltransferase involved in cell wall biosynthesis